jgi:selenocysteine-specific elongation factor
MIIIGTAGHIDHGKTTLVTRLTGIETDRLQEERERGISIELGFAYFDLPSGARCGVIDVPGHEKFVRQMIAGAVGIDVVLLIVAADEGVMPQTREHLDICRLLGVRRGVTVITKTDLVDEEWLELVCEDVREFTEGTFLDGQPVLKWSAVDPDVARTFSEELFAYLQQVAQEPSGRDPSRPFKLSVDRAFSMRGFGTVVTGTVASGELGVGEEVEILPDSIRSRVRGIEVHGVSVDRVGPANRAAINLQGVEKADVHRSSVLVRRGELVPTSMLDATLTVLPNLDRPFEQRSKVLVHIGTAQLLGTVVLLDRDVAMPGEDALVQIRLEHPTVVLPDDPYILRGFEVLANYGKTQGGGRILDPHPIRHRTGRPEIARSLARLRSGSALERAEEIIRIAGHNGLGASELRRRCPLGVGAQTELTDALVAQRTAVRFEADEPTWVHQEAYQALSTKLLAELRGYHERHPARPGIPREELRGKIVHALDPRLFTRLSEDLAARSQIAIEADAVRLASFSPKLHTELQSACAAVLALFESAGGEPPLLADAVAKTGVGEPLVRQAIEVLAREGKLTRLKGDLWFARSAIDDVRAKLIAFLEANGEITTPQFKDLTGTSRKFTIPLGEFFDAEKLTLRVGDNVRRLRRR